MHRRYAILKRFAEAFGPSAAEDEIAQEIRDVLGAEFTFASTPHGNLVAWRPIAKRRARPRRLLMLQAHMDELGFRPFKYLPDGAIQVSSLSPQPDNVANHRIRFRPGDTEGLLIVRTEGPSTRYYLDVGARSADEARRYVPYYATGAFCSRFAMSEGEMSCKSFDDRAGCALIADLLLDCGDDDDLCLVGVFTTREEAGTWPLPELERKLHELGLAPDLLINLEVCPGGPGPGNPDPIVTIGKGVGLVHMERHYAAPADVCKFMVEAAEEEDIPHQHVAMRDGGGELGELAFRLGVRAYGLVVPGRYMHSPNSVISRADFDAAAAMLRTIVHRFREEAP